MADEEEMADEEATPKEEAWDAMSFPDARVQIIKSKFDELPKKDTRSVHGIIFTAEERKEYGYSNFEEDLKDTNADCYSKDLMSWEDVKKFLADNL